MSDSETVDAVRTDLLSCGVRTGGCLLVHASLSALRTDGGADVSGGAETVIQGLLAALGNSGTLLMPALSYQTVDMGHPVFDARKTPSCVGTIPEAFRTRPGTWRSTHPTHSVCAVGPQAMELLADHERDETPCGERSPFRRLREGGQLLFLGCGPGPNTSMHAAEELVEPPYLFGATVSWEGRTMDGRHVGGRYRRHGFVGYRQRYDRMVDLLKGDEVRTGTVLGASVHLMDIPAMWDAGEAALRKNPLYFVESHG